MHSRNWLAELGRDGKKPTKGDLRNLVFTKEENTRIHSK